jgi:hypothetical protein
MAKFDPALLSVLAVLLGAVQVVIGLVSVVLGYLQLRLQQRLMPQQEKLPEGASDPGALPPESWVMRLLNSPWVLPPSFIALDVWWLVHDLRSPAPLTRFDIYNIATMAAAIFFNLSWMSLNSVRRQMRQQAEAMLDACRKISGGIYGLKESVGKGLVPKAEMEKLRGDLENLRGVVVKPPRRGKK